MRVIEKQSKDYWQALKSDFMDFIKLKKYSSNTVKLYRIAVSRLAEYSVSKGYQEYFPELGQMFLESEAQNGYRRRQTLYSRRTAVKRLEEFLYGESRSFPKRQTRHDFPQQFAYGMNNFFQSLRNTGFKESTIKHYQRECSKMMRYFAENGIKDWDGINAKALSEVFEISTYKVCFASYAKRLFKYLVSAGLVKFDFSGILPNVTRPKRLPSVYSPTEIDILLSSVDRTTTIGKRNYAILLLAARLGLRASDISALHFENINFDTSIIKFIQHKTSVEQRLILLPEVAEALSDYIDNGREESDKSCIFLTVNKQSLNSTTVYKIVSKCFVNSGINLGDRHHGPQALRMSFASELIAENVPYEAVRVILGQVERDSTRHYVEFAIESLRSCALEIAPPSGLFAKYLNDEDLSSYGKLFQKRIFHRNA